MLWWIFISPIDLHVLFVSAEKDSSSTFFGTLQPMVKKKKKPEQCPIKVFVVHTAPLLNTPVVSHVM